MNFQAEEKQTAKREKEIDEIMSRVSFEQADKMFFEYADEVMELAKSKNRSTYPIEKVIHVSATTLIYLE